MISFILNTGAELVGKKWRAVVIWHLKDGPLRFSQLKKLLPGVSVKVLSEVLDDMEGNLLITRTQHNDSIPVKVIYDIHPDAHPFIDANVLCTIRIGEYILGNPERFNLTAELQLELSSFLLTAKLPPHGKKI